MNNMNRHYSPDRSGSCNNRRNQGCMNMGRSNCGQRPPMPPHMSEECCGQDSERQGDCCGATQPMALNMPGNCCGSQSEMPGNCRGSQRERQGGCCTRSEMPGSCCRSRAEGPGNCCCEDNSSAVSDSLRGMPLGIGYVPWQQWECTYSLEDGICKGTIFPSLSLPFYGCIPRGYYFKGGRA